MINSLTTLRWLAALYVFLFHIQIRTEFVPQPLSSVVVNGYTGMTFFFILSGFVLAYRYAGNIGSYGAFVCLRLARIYPAFFIAFLFSIPTIQGVSWAVFGLNLSLNVVLQQAWTPNLFSVGINGGTWSLSTEMFFYLLFPFVRPLVLMNATSARSLWLLLCVTWLMSFVPGLIEFLHPLQGSDDFYYSSPIYRLPEFVAGIALADLWRRGHLKCVNDFVVATTAGAFLIGCWTFDGMKNSNLTLLNVVALPLFSSVIVWAAQARPRALEWRPLVYLGEVSYGFYIYQLTFLVSIFPVMKDRFPNGVFLMTAGLAFTVGAASLSFHLVEKPTQRFVKLLIPSRASNSS